MQLRIDPAQQDSRHTKIVSSVDQEGHDVAPGPEQPCEHEKSRGSSKQWQNRGTALSCETRDDLSGQHHEHQYGEDLEQARDVSKSHVWLEVRLPNPTDRLFISLAVVDASRRRPAGVAHPTYISPFGPAFRAIDFAH